MAVPSEVLCDADECLEMTPLSVTSKERASVEIYTGDDVEDVMSKFVFRLPGGWITQYGKDKLVSHHYCSVKCLVEDEKKYGDEKPDERI